MLTAQVNSQAENGIDIFLHLVTPFALNLSTKHLPPLFSIAVREKEAMEITPR